MGMSYNGTLNVPSLIVTSAAPLDVRTVVDSVDDLTNNSISNLYTGIVVNIKGTGDLYVLTTHPRLARQLSSWVKIGAVDLSEYVKTDDLPDFLTGSDLEEYVKVEDLEGYIKPEDLEELASKSDLEGYVKTEDAVEYLTASDLDDYLRVSELPTNVSAFINDAGYITNADLPDFLTGSDLDGYVKVEDVEGYLTSEDIADLVAKSDLDGYVKAEDVADYLTASDLDDYLRVSELPTNVSDFINDAGYLTENDLPDFLTGSDLEDYVKVEDLEGYVKPEDLAELASKSDLEGYVKTEDAIDYLTASDLDGYLKVNELPTNVSAFVNDSGYITNADLPDFLTGSDLDGYVKTEDLEGYLTSEDIADLVEKSDLEGYVRIEDAIDYLTGSDLDDYAKLEDLPEAGAFPDGSDIEEEEAVADGYATVQDVMDYVNALLEKKKIEEDSIRYAYINGYGLNDTPTDITVFHKYLLNATGDTVFELNAAEELSVWDPSTYDDLPSFKFTVDIPDGYAITGAYIWNVISNEYEDINGVNDSRRFATNTRYATREIDGITYYSYVRGLPTDTTARGSIQYKIIITKL